MDNRLLAPDEPTPATFLAKIECIGTEARCLLTVLDKSRVVAVFRGCLYLQSEAAWACLGGASIGRAPMNLPCEATGFFDWRHVARVGDMPLVDASGFLIGSLKVVADGATTWENGPLPLPAVEQVDRGLRFLEVSLPAELPNEGLATFLRSGAAVSSPVARAALLPINELSNWILACGLAQRAAPVPRKALRQLLGLGPGLTPSGDDFLVGFVTGLRAAGMPKAARELSHELVALAPGCTSEISAALIEAALRAGLSEYLQNLLHALLEGDASSINSGIQRLAVQPHYSSWDTLAGITLALRFAIGTTGRG